MLASKDYVIHVMWIWEKSNGKQFTYGLEFWHWNWCRVIEGICAWDWSVFLNLFQCIILLLTIELTIYSKNNTNSTRCKRCYFWHAIHFNIVWGFNTTSNITSVFISILKQFYFCEHLNGFFSLFELLFVFATLWNYLLHLTSQQSNYCYRPQQSC